MQIIGCRSPRPHWLLTKLHKPLANCNVLTEETDNINTPPPPNLKGLLPCITANNVLVLKYTFVQITIAAKHTKTLFCAHLSSILLHLCRLSINHKWNYYTPLYLPSLHTPAEYKSTSHIYGDGLCHNIDSVVSHKGNIVLTDKDAVIILCTTFIWKYRAWYESKATEGNSFNLFIAHCIHVFHLNVCETAPGKVKFSFIPCAL